MKSTGASSMKWLQIIRGEYLEMPGLALTTSQARRLWGLDEWTCASILNALVNETFLRLTADGRYVLTSDAQRARRRFSARAGGN